MTRHVLALAIALCASTSPVSAQAPGTLDTQLTVKATPAEVHKSPTVASTVVGKVQIGTVFDVRRNLGSWIEVPWPGAEGGVAFVHVNAGTIASRTTPVPVRVAAEPASAAAMSDGPPIASSPTASAMRARTA